MYNYDLINFDVIDFKHENVLSSYALKETPLTFIPRLSSFDYLRVLWEFGDGTHTIGLTAEKYYPNEGTYPITLTIYDCYTNAIVSTVQKYIQIYNFLDYTFKVDFEDPTYYDNISWKAGKISGPVVVTMTFPPTKEPCSVFYRVNGSDSDYYFNDSDNKFRHLDKTYSFFKKSYNSYISSDQYDEVDSLTTTPLSVYAKIDGDELVVCDKTEYGSFFVGMSGCDNFYFKDDSVNDLTITLFFDKQKIPKQYSNNLKIGLSASITENDEIDHLSITSNGLDGEYYTVDSFNFDEKKFSYINIPFVIKIKDAENFSVKSFPLLSTTDVTISVLTSGNIVNSSYYEIKDVNSFYGSARGTIKFLNSTKIDDVKLSACLTTTSDLGSTYTITGITNTFNVFPQNFLTIVKKNEKIDVSEIFKGLRFQESLLDKNILFDEFMGTIFGNLSSSYDTLGKKIYEKICNFVENTQDVDRDEIFSLISQMKMMGMNDNLLNSQLFNSPEKIKRLIDIGSISNNKLLGFENKFKENFNTRGHTSKDFYGINLGNEINNDTYVISAGTPIVALEKFSNNYTLLNTEQPVLSLSATTYQLSSYSSDWGWPLVLPDIFTYEDFDKYYIFFEYTPVYDGTLSDFSIYYDPTIYSTLTGENVLTDEDDNIILDEDGNPILIEFDYNYSDYLLNIMFRDTLYQSLSLVQPS